MFKKIDYYFNKTVEYLSMALLVLMTLIVAWVVFSRYFLNRTPAWGEESALLCMVWFGFLCMALGVRDDRHIAIQVIDKLLTPTGKRLLVIFGRILILGFALFMIIEGITMSQVATRNYMLGLKINSSFLYIPVILGGIAITYYILTSFTRDKMREEGI